MERHLHVAGGPVSPTLVVASTPNNFNWLRYLKKMQNMADVCDIIRYSLLDCFWLCDGSLKVCDVPHPWQNPQQIYFGSAAVNVGNRR